MQIGLVNLMAYLAGLKNEVLQSDNRSRNKYTVQKDFPKQVAATPVSAAYVRRFQESVTFMPSSHTACREHNDCAEHARSLRHTFIDPEVMGRCPRTCA